LCYFIPDLSHSNFNVDFKYNLFVPLLLDLELSLKWALEAYKEKLYTLDYKMTALEYNAEEYRTKDDG